MPRPMKTAKHKLNSAHVHGALVIAGFLGLVTGNWASCLRLACSLRPVFKMDPSGFRS